MTYYSKAMSKPRVFFFLVLLLVAAAVRLIDIGPRTEFLGDQGVITAELYTSLQNYRLPETGLVHSNGIRSGPIMYYLFVPAFILSGREPVGIAFFMAFLGVATVYLIFAIGKNLFGLRAAMVVSGLYAVSPFVASQSRAVWPPALVPFFVALLLFACVKMRASKNPAWLMLGSVSVAVVSQMYIPALPSFLFLGAAALLIFFGLRSYLPAKTFVFWFAMSVLCFVFIWLPYLGYESSHQFEDLRTLILTTFFPSAPSSALASSLADRLRVILSVFDKLFPISVFAGGILLAIAIVTGGFWGKLLALWYIVASLPVLVFRGPTFEHYAVAFIPLPFLFLGFALRFFSKYSKKLLYGAGLVLLLTQLSFMPKTPTPNDLYRTNVLTDEMAARSEGDDFSFTVLSSRSFSDYHYRYYFLRKGISPRSIYDDDYPVLYLICEQTACPAWKDIQNRRVVHVLCFEKHCEPTYPDKRIDGWELIEIVSVADSQFLKLGRTKPVVQ